MTLKELKEKEQSSLVEAIENFAHKNQYEDEDIMVTVVNEQKAILRLPGADLPELKAAEKTIYHGWRFDVYTFTCNTRTSGSLVYDDTLTDEYRYKCSDY